MATIRRLSPHEIAQIAAGEVIERPANVVKELLENSIDAGATEIVLQLQRAGKQSIEVIDNGCGMSYEDAYLAVTQHATSKLPSIETIQNITTLGFRGEALATIAAVSSFTLQTRTSATDHGIKLVYKGGKLVREEPVAIAQGTQISVENLFGEIPARKKFLKADDTELRAILQTVQAIAFAYPQLHFKVAHNGKTIYNLAPVTSIAARTAQLYGAEYAQATTLFETTDAEMRIAVAATDATFLRYDRSHIVLLVNNRWVKNSGLSRAVLNGYNALLAQGKYPTVCVHITMNTTLVDVNAHPRKEEVRFLHPKQTELAVTTAVSKALEQYTRSSILGDLQTEPKQQLINSSHQTNFSPTSFSHLWEFMPQASLSEKKVDYAPAQETIFVDVKKNNFNESVVLNDNITQPSPHALLDEQQIIAAVRDMPSLVGYFANTYLLVEKKDGLFVVDQHAAHERIMYHRFATQFDSITKRRFAIPEILRCDASEIDFVHKHQELFESLGITLHVTGEKEVAVVETPSFCNAQQAIELCRLLLSQGLTDSVDKLDLYAVNKYLSHTARARMSCIAAVKAGTALSRDEQIKLLLDLQETPDNTHCPHGRPTGWVLTRYEIEKRFRRVGG